MNGSSAWYVLYTRPKLEARVSKLLQDRNIESFLPTHRVLRFWADRKKYLEVPLFPCYVFVNTTHKERYQALRVNGVVRFVSFLGQPAVVPESQIHAIRAVLNEKMEFHTEPLFKVGQRVEIMGGPLEGIAGHLEEVRGKTRFIVNIDCIDRSLTIEIDRSLLRVCQN